MLQLFFASLLSVLFVGCAHTGPIASVKAGDKNALLYSNSDSGSAMPKLSENGKVSNVIDDTKEILEDKPRDKEAHFDLAQLYLGRGDLAKAEEHLRSGLKIDLSSDRGKKIMAQLFYRKGNHEMAEIIANRLGGVSSRDPDVINLMGLISYHAGRMAESHARFKKAIKLDASHASARMNLGVIYMRNKQLDRAAVQFERVLQIVPEHNDARLHMAVIHVNRGNYSAAEEAYAELLKRKSDNPVTTYNLAVLQKHKNEFDDALDNLKEFLQSSYAKEKSNSRTFALIEDIKLRKEAAGEQVSDEQIQALAAELKKGPKTAEATPKVSPTEDTPAKAKPEKEPVKNVPEPKRKGDDESIEDLENMLVH